jgi:hypothetical protein
MALFVKKFVHATMTESLAKKLLLKNIFSLRKDEKRRGYSNA